MATMIGTRMRNLFVLSTLALFTAVPLQAQLPRGEPAEVGMSASRLRELDTMIQGYIDRGEFNGAVALIARDGKVVRVHAAGVMNASTREPMRPDAIFRIASMTKPVTGVAAMMLVEEGKLSLSDPVSKYIPAFQDMKVAVRDQNAPDGYRLEPAVRPITIEHLMTHRSGLTYGFLDRGYVGNAYRAAGITDGVGGATHSLEENVNRIAAQPLVAQPGERFQYGVSTDVLGRVVEVVSGMPLDEFFRTRIFEPLGMHDTGFMVPAEKASRVVAMHAAQNGTVSVVEDPMANAIGTKPPLFSGGGGLFSTAEDYALFAQMLLNRGELNGRRLLKPETVDLMVTNHTADINPGFVVGAGRGYGLTLSMITDPEASTLSGPVGAYDWYGIYGSNFWVDPHEKLIGIGMINLSPNSAGSFREAIRAVTYEAVDTWKSQEAAAAVGATAR